MSYEKDLLTGIAQMISDSSIAVYKSAGVYSAGDNAIVFGDWPQAPDTCVVLNYTPVTDATMIPMGRGILEVHCRGAQGDPFGATEPAVAIFQLLHGLRNHPFGTANVIQLLRDHTAPLEQDTSRRSKRVDIYFVDVDAPPTTNRPDGGTW